MRTLHLVRIAAEAEGVRLRERARRGMIRAMFGVIAMGFLLAAVVFSQIAIWYWLRLYWAEPGAALAIVGANLVVAVLLLLVAARSSPGRVEMEALAVRRRALDSATGSIELATLVMQLLNRLIDLLSRKRS
jgi:hypothetical protein